MSICVKYVQYCVFETVMKLAGLIFEPHCWYSENYFYVEKTNKQTDKRKHDVIKPS